MKYDAAWNDLTDWLVVVYNAPNTPSHVQSFVGAALAKMDDLEAEHE